MNLGLIVLGKLDFPKVAVLGLRIYNESKSDRSEVKHVINYVDAIIFDCS